ncbi:LamG-like jellyroll fold domain-containing protein [Nitrosopumilus sp. S6]
MKERRALSTVVGGVFFLIVIMTAASYLTYSMGLFDTFSQTVFVIDQEREDRQKETFEISNILIENKKFNLTVENTGELPIKLSRLWVENTTGTDQVYKYDLDYVVSTGSTITNIGQNLGLTALDSQTYKMKLVTDRGSTKEFLVNSANESLLLQLFALPEEVPTDFKTTLLLSVTNNATKNIILTNLQPTLNAVSLGATAVLEGSIPEPHPVLEPGNTAFFEWHYRLTGEDGQKVRFDASLENGIPGNIVSKEVEIQKISFAEQSTNALQSSLLSPGSSIGKDILIFHTETLDALDGRQMWSSLPEDNLGEVIDLRQSNAVFYTNYDGNVTVNIPDGNWNSTLRYISSPVPDSLMHTGSDSETMAYHFESDVDSPLDATGNTIMSLGIGINRPIWNGTGHQGAGAFQFSGQQYASITVTSDNNIQDSPSTTSGWFKASSAGPVSNQVIYYGDNTGGTKYYKLFLNQNGHFVFQIDTGSTTTTCTSTSFYKDDLWHHFVAVMPDDNDCILYIDGILRDSQSFSGNSSISLQGNIYIGASNQIGLEGFVGSIDDIIHWNDYALVEDLLEQEVTDLFNTNYGTSAHLLDFDIRIVDQLGNNLGVSNKTVTQSFSYPMKYMSDFGEYNNPISDIWGQFNFTSYVSENKIIDQNERLKFNMTMTVKPLGHLDMKMIIDDSDVVSGLGNSFLQTPNPSISYPGFFTYDNSERGSLNIFNPSADGHFIKYQSRVIFEDELTGIPYASFIDNTGSTSINPNQDSPIMPSNQTSTFEFEKPRSQPGNTSSDLIPEGRYNLYVFLDGYDQKGQIFLQTTKIGVVRVI